jgi:hypothetical protein
MPLVWISISFIAGIITANVFSLPEYFWLGTGLIFFILFFLLRNPAISNNLLLKQISGIHYFYFILPAFFLLGAWWYQFRQPVIDAFHVAFYNDRSYEILVMGTLTEPPDLRDTYTNLKLKVEAVDSGSGDLSAGGGRSSSEPRHLRIMNTASGYGYAPYLRLRPKMKNFPTASIWRARAFNHIHPVWK